MRQEGDIEVLKTACSLTKAVTCATAILILAGSATNGFADDGLWGAVAHYEYNVTSGTYDGYGVAINAPSMAEALTMAVERCQEEEQKLPVPAYIREGTDWTGDWSGKRCDGISPTALVNPGYLDDTNRRVFSTSVPQPPGYILDALPAVQAVHARCVVMTLHWNADYPEAPKSFAHSFTSDPTARVGELLTPLESNPEVKARIESINCNDR